MGQPNFDCSWCFGNIWFDWVWVVECKDSLDLDFVKIWFYRVNAWLCFGKVPIWFDFSGVLILIVCQPQSNQLVTKKKKRKKGNQKRNIKKHAHASSGPWQHGWGFSERSHVWHSQVSYRVRWEIVGRWGDATNSPFWVEMGRPNLDYSWCFGKIWFDLV